MSVNERDKFKILSFDATKLYEVAHQIYGENNINIRETNGKLNIDYFKAYLDPSLETDQLEKVYSQHRDEMNNKFRVNVDKYNLTTAIVNVDFDKAYKIYNAQRYPKCMRYVRAGYSQSDYEIHDHICVQEIEGKPTLIAIELPYFDSDKRRTDLDMYGKVNAPIDASILSPYFTFDKEQCCYVREVTDNGNVRQFKTIKKCSELRADIYVNGFYADGIHYVRYKRSAGRSREGSCFFIAEPLYKDMMEWSATGIDASKVSDLASWEAYIALTLSNREKVVEIPKASILVLKDLSSVFMDRAMAVEKVAMEDGKEDIIASPKDVTIANKIWDGEALIDKSVFDDNGYSGCGMMQLRNRFFKTCGFNTNIQQWFRDNNITKVSELNGYTTARKVEDIKMIVTDSSVKYLKMVGADLSDKRAFGNAVDMWLKNIDKYFGVVKTDAPSKTLGGGLVPTTYQLLNTLPLTRDDVKELITPTIDYIEHIKASPMYLRHYINYRLSYLDEEDREYDEGALLDYRFTATLDMLDKCDEFSGTEFYQAVQRGIVKNIKEQMKHGKILVSGLYATLFGNGAELLKACIKKDYTIGESEIKGSNIYNTRFQDGEELLCSRNPHVTMGNILVTNNQKSAFYDKYFNLTDEIVCVNAIDNNIQQRLNGCDYDSDTMLITDNSLLVSSAKSNYDKYMVPTCLIESSSVKYENSLRGKAQLDEVIAKNAIGQIVNLSQLLNSYLWDVYHNDHDEAKEDVAYAEIAKLAVLSGIEIDKAKRLYDINVDSVIDNISQFKKWVFKTGNPKFFEYVNKRSVKNCVSIDTAMEYVYEAGRDENICKDRIDLSNVIDKKATNIKLMDLVDGHVTSQGSNDYRYKGEIIDIARKTERALEGLSKKMRAETESEKILSREKKATILSECMKDISRKLKNDNIVKLLLSAIDNDKNISTIKNILFGVICSEPSGRFYRMVTRHRSSPMMELVRCEISNDNTINIFGMPHYIRVVK